MLLLNAIGIACIKYSKFRELDSILKLSVPAPNFMTVSYREPLLTLLGSTHWNYETWNELIGQRYYYPISFFLLNELRPLFEDFFVVNSEYENTFYIWERMKSLIYGYCRICSSSPESLTTEQYDRMQVKIFKDSFSCSNITTATIR